MAGWRHKGLPILKLIQLIRDQAREKKREIRPGRPLMAPLLDAEGEQDRMAHIRRYLELLLLYTLYRLMEKKS